MQALLLSGAVGAAGFIVVFVIDGATRSGYRVQYHPVSALALGSRGWVQTANFYVAGALVMLGGIGGIVSGYWVTGLLVVLLGVALIGSGVFAMDPMRGYPPGTPKGTPKTTSRAHALHDAFGAGLFAGLPLTALVAGFAIDSTGWSVYAWATAAASTVLFSVFGQAWEDDWPKAGLIQRITLLVSFVWLAALFLHLAGWL